jgi:hypothetical protein
MKSISNAFQEFAWFSVQVDQYYAATRIFARHYDALKLAYNLLPRGADSLEDNSCLNDAAKAFYIGAGSALNCMGTTGIFAEAPYPELKSLPTDIVNFGFYTCYCFQWTLFENFVKHSLLGLADESILPSYVMAKLRKLERRTNEFFQYLDSGEVFGHSPFTTVLPKGGWIAQFEQCSYADLNAIREQRNKFIHAVEGTAILPNTEIEKERLYQRSMWILRQFAGNIYQDVQRLRTPLND